MKNVIIVDLDGTVCDHLHRVHLGQAGVWEEYHAACVDDEPNEDVATIIRMILAFVKFDVIFLTGRNEKFRSVTIEWLRKHRLYSDTLLMRPDGNYERTEELKLKMLEEYFGNKEIAMERILFALDDTDRIVEAFRNYGLPCWQVRQGMY